MKERARAREREEATIKMYCINTTSINLYECSKYKQLPKYLKAYHNLDANDERAFDVVEGLIFCRTCIVRMPRMSLPDCEARRGCFFCLPRPRGLSLKSTVSGSTTLMVEVESSSRAGPPSWPRVSPWPRHSSVLRSSWSSFTIIFRDQGAPGAGRRAHHDDKQGRAPVLAEEPQSGEARWRCGLRRRL